MIPLHFLCSNIDMKYAAMFKKLVDAIIAIVVLYVPMCFYGIFTLNILKTTGTQLIEDKSAFKNKTNEIVSYSLFQVLLNMVCSMLPYSTKATGLLFIIISMFAEILYWDWNSK